MFGSGLPFARPMGFDELHSFRDGLPFPMNELKIKSVESEPSFFATKRKYFT